MYNGDNKLNIFQSTYNTHHPVASSILSGVFAWFNVFSVCVTIRFGEIEGVTGSISSTIAGPSHHQQHYHLRMADSGLCEQELHFIKANIRLPIWYVCNLCTHRTTKPIESERHKQTPKWLTLSHEKISVHFSHLLI